MQFLEDLANKGPKIIAQQFTKYFPLQAVRKVAERDAGSGATRLA
jgi:hypothetical protein